MSPGNVLSRRTTDSLIRSGAMADRATAVAESQSVRTLADSERAHIIATLHETNWVVGGARGAAVRLWAAADDAHRENEATRNFERTAGPGGGDIAETIAVEGRVCESCPDRQFVQQQYNP